LLQDHEGDVTGEGLLFVWVPSEYRLGAVWNTCKVEVNSSVTVFGLGAVVSTFVASVVFEKNV
jgi:Zn-dependent alcohol dehydrogenase